MVKRMQRWWVVGFAALAVVGLPATWAAPPKGRPVRQPTKQTPIRLPAETLDEIDSPFEVARLDRADRSAVLEAAGRIDSLLDLGLSAGGQQPSETLSDAQFLRRIYVDLGGRIPSYEEAVQHLGRGDQPIDRPELIDQVLESPDYVSNFYNYWADVLRLSEAPQPNLLLGPYLDYVKQSIRENKPYDQWVYEMLTAEGKVWDNPAVGFQLRDDGMPLPYVDNTVRVFLGTQIGCAQCHDHPFDRWTQYEFYKLAAFTNGTRTRIGRRDPEFRGNRNPSQALIAEARKEAGTGKVPGDVQRVIRANNYIVRNDDARLRLPHDYAYDNAEPKDLVKPGVLWGEVPQAKRSAPLREQFAAWIAGGDNRQFARNIANRMWKLMMGVGLVEPIDDFREDNPASSPALLEILTDEMIRVDYDLKEFVRIIANTQAYQRQAVEWDPSDESPFRYAGPALRRMSAEQIWDSILTLSVRNPWGFQRQTAEDYKAAIDIDLGSATLEDVRKQADAYRNTSTPGAVQKKLRRISYQGQALVRASELPTPLPLGHFLRQFGQSDREDIAGGRTVATVPQLLAMFNGPFTHMMLERGSVVYDNILSADGRGGGADVIFLSVLTRYPTADDKRLIAGEIRHNENVATAMGNVLWALLNTREFLFIQ